MALCGLQGDGAMSPQTVRRIAQEIRHQRDLLTAEERWTQQQPKSPMRDEAFRRIVFWRRFYERAEQELTQMLAESDPSPMAASA